MTDLARDANVLGALALVVADRTSDAIAAASGQSETAGAALSALHHFLDGPSIDLLRQVLGLTPSGTVRLVDRLVAAGYVTRGPGADGRSRSVVLTAEGRRAADRVARARADVLGSALAELSPGERATLQALLARILATFVRGPGATRWVCRLCDTGACGRADGLCPAANAAAAHR
ncbi:MAG TPA: MarR family winged helix-turn-helix transcriptional regulator [Terriglobales bacterium]|nr:MarR family winged helix-turn-helix transcriptional regulator [Terriglobales bacterium]